MQVLAQLRLNVAAPEAEAPLAGLYAGDGPREDARTLGPREPEKFHAR